MSSPRALVVEDSREVARILERLLTAEGYAVTGVASGEEAVMRAKTEQPELILLDLSLPDGDGVEFCRRLRTFTDAYVVMVTGRSGEMDKVVGLSVGADDYLTKPFSPRELAARLRAMRRRPRAGAGSQGLREFPGLQVDVDSREVTVDGNPVTLTKIEFDLLDALSSAPRRTLSRERLLNLVWGEWYGDTHILDVHVGNLRRKLGESGSDARFITTVRGVGFRFEPPERD